MSTESSRRALLQMIGNRLLPLTTRSQPPTVVLMEPDHLVRSGQKLTRHPGKPLRFGKRMRSPILLQQWDEQQLQASRFPCLLAVMEGEIDWRVGITQQEGPSDDSPLEQTEYLTVPVSEGTFFLTPAGVPYSAGHGVHWERARPREGQALVFWMIILPSGFMCHFCRSTATDHRSFHSFFVLNSSIYQLTRMLEKELAGAQPGRGSVIQAHLQAILIYARRALEQHVTMVPLESESSSQELPRLGPDMAEDAMQRVRAHIEAHLREPLSPASVAAHAYVSPRHLERYFQRELGMSITDYIIRRRIEAARVLLQDTDLLVRQVGEMVGYPNQSSFTQIFKRYTGTSPRACRLQRRERYSGSKGGLNKK